MPDHRLMPRHALGGDAPRRAALGAVTIVEGPDLAIASLAARRDGAGACHAALADLTGRPPPAPGRIDGATGIEALWSGPDQWLLLAPHGTHEDLPDRVKARVGASGSVTEQTDGWVCLTVTGAGTTALFERICMLDTAAATPGFAARTPIHHIAAFVICDAGGWRVLGPRSSAASLFDALAHTAGNLAETTP